jgi:hypothetical protein
MIIIYYNAMGYWNEKKEKIKQKYPIITDNDLIFYEGKEKEMVEQLGYRLGITIEEMRSVIAKL